MGFLHWLSGRTVKQPDLQPDFTNRIKEEASNLLKKLKVYEVFYATDDGRKYRPGGVFFPVEIVAADIHEALQKFDLPKGCRVTSIKEISTVLRQL